MKLQNRFDKFESKVGATKSKFKSISILGATKTKIRTFKKLNLKTFQKQNQGRNTGQQNEVQ